MKTTEIIKRSYYLTLALAQMSWYMTQNIVSAIDTTMFKGQKVVWAYKRKIEPDEVAGAIVHDHMKGESYFLPEEPVKKPRKVNNYHLRYQYSSRGV